MQILADVVIYADLHGMRATGNPPTTIPDTTLDTSDSCH